MTGRGARPARRAGAAGLACALLAGGCAGGKTATPSEAVDAFHAALATGDAARALSRLAADVVVLEAGAVDRSRDAYAAGHLGADAELSRGVDRELVSRQVGRAGEVAWVLSTYRLRGRPGSGVAIDMTSAETAVPRQSGNRWRIVHLHRSSR